MTCVVAVEHGGRVWMGSDSFMGSEQSRDTLDQPKMFRVGTGLLVGFAGAFRAAQLAQYGLTVRQRRSGELEMAYLVTAVAKSLQKAHRDACLPGASRADFLIALAGKVYTLQEDYSVLRSAHGYAAIGAGCDVALGALAVLSPELSPRKRVEAALAAAAKHHPQVAPPFPIMTL